MGNLCAIFHMRFRRLIKIIPSVRKAQLVDYILLGWQNSTYKLRNSDHKWFMKPYSQIVEDTGIAKSTLERYIKELHDEGFIERRQALYSRTKEHGEFEVKKGTYIHITDKLLNLIAPAKTVLDPSSELEVLPEANYTVEAIHTENTDAITIEKEVDSKTTCYKSDQNEGTDPLILMESYIRDLYSSNPINNIIFKKTTHSVDKTPFRKLTQQFESIQNLLYSEIKEEISDEIKKIVAGTFFNLMVKNKQSFSSPKQLVAEYLYALLNVDFYFPQIRCFKHRNNILSKMLRENRWLTPKGFYKYFYLGQFFKDQQEIREKRWIHQKNNEINLYCIGDKKDKRLIQLEEQMHEKSNLINQLIESIPHESNEETIAIIQENIKTLRSELKGLWQQQDDLEKKIEQENIINNGVLCA